MNEKCRCKGCPNRTKCKKGWNLLITNFAKLINVKTLVTFAVIAVFVILSLTKTEINTQVLTIVTMVIAFYFGTQHEKKSGKLDKVEDIENAIVQISENVAEGGDSG